MDTTSNASSTSTPNRTPQMGSSRPQETKKPSSWNDHDQTHLFARLDRIAQEGDLPERDWRPDPALEEDNIRPPASRTSSELARTEWGNWLVGGTASQYEHIPFDHWPEAKVDPVEVEPGWMLKLRDQFQLNWVLKRTKQLTLVTIALCAFILYAAHPESENEHFVSLAPNQKAQNLYIHTAASGCQIVQGVLKLVSERPAKPVLVSAHLEIKEGIYWNQIGERWNVTIRGTSRHPHRTTWDLKRGDVTNDLRCVVDTYGDEAIAVRMSMYPAGWIGRHQVAMAVAIIGVVYVLIVFELVHRSVASLIGAFMGIGILSVTSERPGLETVMSWIQIETVGLLFGMMVMVGIFQDTGFFEWCALQAYRLSAGSVWKVYVYLSVFTAVVSAFLDNVTTVMLVVPVTVRLARVLETPPVPLLITLVVFSNIGGTATLIGDPPNVIIGAQVSEFGIGFGAFMLNLSPLVIIATIACLFYIRYRFKDYFKLSKASGSNMKGYNELESVPRRLTDPVGESSLRPQGGQSASASRAQSAGPSRRDSLDSMRSVELSRREEGREKLAETLLENEGQVALMELKTYGIRNKVLFIDTSLVLITVIMAFCLNSLIGLELAWIPLYGATALLIMIEPHDLENAMLKVEWGTLLFFAGLSVLMHALDGLGFIRYFGDGTRDIIVSVPEEWRLTVALILLLVVSALVSAFIDNIPYTTTMVPVVLQLAEDPDLKLPLAPLVWALAFGTCLGGNGTLIGASANVVMAGIAQQNGLPISFVTFFRIGFPIMCITIVLAAIYLILVYVVILGY